MLQLVQEIVNDQTISLILPALVNNSHHVGIGFQSQLQLQFQC